MTLTARLSRKGVPYTAVALLLALLTGAAIANAWWFLGDNGAYFVVGGILALLFGFAILVDWRLGAYALAAALPFEGLLTYGAIASGIKVLGFLTYFSLGLTLLRDPALFTRLRSLLNRPLFWGVAAFSFWSATSTLWAVNQEAALVKTATFVGLLGLAITVGLLEKRQLILLWSLAASSAVLSVPLGYLLPAPDEGILVSGRFTSGGNDPNDYAGLLVIVFFVVFYGLARQLPRSARLVLILPVLVGVLLSQSRTALIMLGVAPLLVLLSPGVARRSAKFTLLLYGIGGAVFAVIVYSIPSLGKIASDRYSTLLQYQNENTWSGRLDIWQGTLQAIQSHPILGVGSGNFSEVISAEPSPVPYLGSVQESVAVAHNMFLSVASELGLVGLAVFLFVVFSALRQASALARRNVSLGLGLLLGLVAYLIGGMALTWEYTKISYLLYGSVLALSLRTTRESSAGEIAAQGRRR